MKYFIFSLCFLLFFQGNNFSQTNRITIGNIEEIKSKILNEKRILNIYLPDNYNPADSLKYPIIYLLDGSIDEDFIHIVGLVQFNSFEWVKQLPKSIVVGIANIDRKKDFTFPTSGKEEKEKFPTTGNSIKFINFIENELQPFINSNYKTTNVKTIIGESLAGLLATQILFTKPSLFSNYIIVSPSLWWDNGSLLSANTSILKDSLQNKTSVYIAVGKEGLTPTKQPRVMEVDANLLVEKLQAIKSTFINITFDYLPQENHGTIMHQAVFNAIKQLNKIK